jgi:hypothetical protein
LSLPSEIHWSRSEPARSRGVLRKPGPRRQQSNDSDLCIYKAGFSAANRRRFRVGDLP